MSQAAQKRTFPNRRFVPGTDSCAAAESYSIPSSARASSVGGISGLAALAL
jgi:hypothetical protein